MRTSKKWYLYFSIVIGLALAATVLVFAEARANRNASNPDSPEAGFPVMNLLYRFSGVSDDGEQGSANRKEATSIHCTNFDPVSDAQVEVQLYQWNGTDVFTGTVNMPPNRTFTFSTQNTTIYFDDVILGGNPGTEAIFQGSGQILASHRRVVCSAQVLDPLSYPPVYAVRLPLYDPDGNLVKRSMPDPNLNLPIIER